MASGQAGAATGLSDAIPATGRRLAVGLPGAMALLQPDTQLTAPVTTAATSRAATRSRVDLRPSVAG